MAYCERCGAYIPDGQTKCVACGFDPAASRQYNAGAAYEQQDWQEEIRREEERRRKEEERQQRKEQYRRNAEAEFARRQKEQAERERQASSYVNSHPYSRSGNVNSQSAGSTKVNSGKAYSRRVESKANSKVFAALSYLGFLWILPYIVCPEDKFAKFHAKQGLGLFIFQIVGEFIGRLLRLNWLFIIFYLYCIYKGMSGALNGKTEELPVIGKLIKPTE